MEDGFDEKSYKNLKHILLSPTAIEVAKTNKYKDARDKRKDLNILIKRFETMKAGNFTSGHILHELLFIEKTFNEYNAEIPLEIKINIEFYKGFQKKGLLL